LEQGLVLAKQVLSQLSYTPADYSFYFNDLRTDVQLVFERSKNVVLIFAL
jgi:hypothetical protein